MKRMSIMFFALVLVIASCKKTEESSKTSFKMTYDGITYTQAEEQSLNVTFGTVAAKGEGAVEFLLTVIGVGADGSTTQLCQGGCDGAVMLDFGAVEGKEAFVATSGTITRTGKKIEVDVSGLTTSGTSKSLTAKVVVANFY